ncbi:hypothetical protein GWK47_034474 [Chionoecetes opilio]|uniref:Uncharacterized protein n=1 Tax=Chionoecetes opilio TaxID=41210 RepID=A0A8J4YIX5_CHIOP|nr:hypothetical protein GWK47_034474 [Chionoecetes opilio]
MARPIAEPRRRRKWTLNPRGSLWANGEGVLGCVVLGWLAQSYASHHGQIVHHTRLLQCSSLCFRVMGLPLLKCSLLCLVWWWLEEGEVCTQRSAHQCVATVVPLTVIIASTLLPDHRPHLTLPPTLVNPFLVSSKSYIISPSEIRYSMLINTSRSYFPFQAKPNFTMIVIT